MGEIKIYSPEGFQKLNFQKFPLHDELMVFFLLNFLLQNWFKNNIVIHFFFRLYFSVEQEYCQIMVMYVHRCVCFVRLFIINSRC